MRVGCARTVVERGYCENGARVGELLEYHTCDSWTPQELEEVTV